MESANDGFKWFGEGFDGFPKKLPDDTVEYLVFLLDSNASDSQTASGLRTILQQVITWYKKAFKDYIWQRQSFNLELQKQHGRWCLYGRTNFGDSISDEWLIVYILRELSRRNAKAWIRVFDADGEFLLIEAAEVLPRWLEPHVAENRVWIHNGELRIIPLTDKNSEKESRNSAPRCALKLPEAFAVISTDPLNLIHSPLIEEEAFYRIRDYPEAISSTFHHTLIKIPRLVAYLLHRNPAFVSPAVEAFYLRDPVSLRSVKLSQLVFPPKELVTTSAKFPRVAYAQLKSQIFDAPDVWKDHFSPDTPLSEADQARLDLGMKLTCGFEMLLADTQHQTKRHVHEIRALMEDIDSGEEPLPTDEEIRAWGERDDKETWMEVDYPAFEARLAGKGGVASGGKRKDNFAKAFGGDEAAQQNLTKLVERFEVFMNDDEAGFEGAQFDDDDGSDDSDDSSTDGGEDKEVSFDEAEFSRLMREMMGMPSEEQSLAVPHLAQQASVNATKGGDSDRGSDSEEEEVMREMAGIEKELKEAGVLNLEPAGTGAKQIDGKGKAPMRREDGDDGDDEGEEDLNKEVEIDYALAKNMLESFKAQGGMAGPAGNLMGLMGVKFAPDADEVEDDDTEQKEGMPNK